MRTKITLACTECKQRNYNTTKDKKTHPDRMETKKYCRFCKTHTMHKETKYYIWKKERKMADSAKTKTKKPGCFKNVSIEFKKIIWPDKNTMFKQSIAVVAISIVLGIIIAAIDALAKYGVNFLTSL